MEQGLECLGTAEYLKLSLPMLYLYYNKLKNYYPPSFIKDNLIKKKKKIRIMERRVLKLDTISLLSTGSMSIFETFLLSAQKIRYSH